MFLPRFLLLLGACYASVAARRMSAGGIEVLSAGERSMTARFRPKGNVKNYFVSVNMEGVADRAADYTTYLSPAATNSDGYLYIETQNTLQPGRTYEIWLADAANYDTVYRATFFTKCEKYTYQCMNRLRREICVGPTGLCDGYAVCKNGEDEEKDAQGNCRISLPTRPTPPPPPEDAPCLVEQREAIAAGRDDYLGCEQDGSYSPMHCLTENGMFNCYCIDKTYGIRIPGPRLGYSAWSDWDFYEICEKQGEGSPEVALPPGTGGIGIPGLVGPPAGSRKEGESPPGVGPPGTGGIGMPGLAGPPAPRFK